MHLNENVRQRLGQGKKVVAFTGAGMSAESGVATFRDHADDAALWGRFNPLDVATPTAFAKDPQRVWDWYVSRANAVAMAAPNTGHIAISRLAEVVEVTVVTQNVDDLHTRAGSLNVIELHGNLFKVKPFWDEEALAHAKSIMTCPTCCNEVPSDVVDAYGHTEGFKGIKLVAGAVPHCPTCNSLARPDVVWFGEQLDPVVLDAAVAAVEACDVLICVGASLEVEPAASLPFMALTKGAVVIEINPSPTTLSELADAYIAGSAAEVLPELFKKIWGVEP